MNSLKRNNLKNYHLSSLQMKFPMKRADLVILRSLARLTSMMSLLTVMMEGQAMVKTMMKRKEKKKKKKWLQEKMLTKKMKRTMQTKSQMRISQQIL